MIIICKHIKNICVIGIICPIFHPNIYFVVYICSTRVLSFKKYDSSEERIYTVHPYFIKSYQKRLYLIGNIVEKSRVSVLALNRKQCFKEKNEDFFRQTVLNILGLFKDARVISGLPHSLAQSVFPDISPNLARNISRGTSSTVFPQGTDEHVRFYVEKLLNGDI